MNHVCIIVAKFYPDIADELLRGATVRLKAANLSYEVVEVPGAFEIPAALSMAIKSGKYGGYVTLGCVIRGETSHYDHVCAETARGLNQLAMGYHALLGFGVLTVENEDQAWARASVKDGDKGGGAAEACVQMMAVRNAMNAA